MYGFLTSKAPIETKRRAPDYSRALHRSRGVVQRVVQKRFRSGCGGLGGRRSVKVGVVYLEGERRRIG